MRDGDVRAGVQAGRRPAARDAGRPHPHGDRGRRVRRHRRPGHHRGHPRGDRRRDHRRVRRASARRSSGCDDGAVRVTARLPVEDLGELFDVELPADEVETVGRPARPGAGPGADPGRRRRPSAACSWSPRAPPAGATGSTRCWCAGSTPSDRPSRRPTTRGEATRRCLTSPSSSAEDAKLVTLARAARARIGAVEGAAVRDGDGRTYAAATVALPSLSLSALQLAVATRSAAGATRLEAAAVVTEASTLDGAGHAAVRDLAADAPVHLAAPDGTARSARSCRDVTCDAEAAVPGRVRLLRRAAQRRQVDADQRDRRAEDRDHVEQAADHPARHPRRAAPARRPARPGRHARACTGRAPCSASASTTWSARPGARST